MCSAFKSSLARLARGLLTFSKFILAFVASSAVDIMIFIGVGAVVGASLLVAGVRIAVSEYRRKSGVKETLVRGRQSETSQEWGLESGRRPKTGEGADKRGRAPSVEMTMQNPMASMRR